jgi:hypothetical protein
MATPLRELIESIVAQRTEADEPVRLKVYGRFSLNFLAAFFRGASAGLGRPCASAWRIAIPASMRMPPCSAAIISSCAAVCQRGLL